MEKHQAYLGVIGKKVQLNGPSRKCKPQPPGKEKGPQEILSYIFLQVGLEGASGPLRM